MKIPNITDLIREVIGLIPRRDIEKLVFKMLLGIWLFIILAVIILKFTVGAKEDLEKKMMGAATNVKAQARGGLNVEKYEALLNLAKHPEEFSRYSTAVRRDPFSEYKGIAIALAKSELKRDFSLRSIGRLPLPMVYKGYIELEDKVIGQVNWRNKTMFIEQGSTIDGYTIYSVSKSGVEAIDEKGQRIEFELNKPVLSEKLQAVLFDRISRNVYTVQVASEIDNYKVIDIAPNYVILLAKGEEIRLEL